LRALVSVIGPVPVTGEKNCPINNIDRGSDTTLIAAVC
jgi:hypothetical protein